jgi:hypothetical protein
MQPNRETSEVSLPHHSGQESSLDRFFQLSTELRHEISDLHVSYDALLKKHKACVRRSPILLTSSRRSRPSPAACSMSPLVSVTCGCRPPDFPDREHIVTNLHAATTERFHEFCAKFKLEQRAFSERVGEASHKQKANTSDFAPIDFGTPGSSHRQLQMQLQRNEEELETIMRQAEAIRNVFVELANLISEQGTIIDRIDFCISHTLENAVEAHRNVEKAAQYQGKSRMWICVVVLLIVIALLLVMAFLK